MDIKLSPAKLSGQITVVPSKSISHRALICAALAKGESVISNLLVSQDITATTKAMAALGAKFDFEGTTVRVRGVSAPPTLVDIDCNESGSTLRFVMPIAAALGANATFFGRGRLPERPITPYLRELPKKNVQIAYNATMPFVMNGKLRPGVFELEGDISSQFVSGLLLALPLLEGDSEIILTSPLESAPYVTMTIDCMRMFGVQVGVQENGFTISGGQEYLPTQGEIESDYSQAAFFLVANALGSDVTCAALNPQSHQGDRAIVDIIDKLQRDNMRGFEVDVAQIPDLVPILAVLACGCKGRSRIYNAARLRIKESDRLQAISMCLNKVGGQVTAEEDALIIDGTGHLDGGEVESWGDHRIAMAMAVASTICKQPVIIKDAQCVEKSYPSFWEEFQALTKGGEHELNLG